MYLFYNYCMKINSVSHYSSRNNSKTFNARIPKSNEVVQAFGVADKYLVSGRRSDCKKVGEFCTAIRNILEYKPNEDVIFNCNRTLYRSSLGAKSNHLFTYYYCNINVCDNEITMGTRVCEPKVEELERAKLCFDALKVFGSKIAENFSEQQNNFCDLKSELQSLKNTILK